MGSRQFRPESATVCEGTEQSRVNVPAPICSRESRALARLTLRGLGRISQRQCHCEVLMGDCRVGGGEKQGQSSSSLLWKRALEQLLPLLGTGLLQARPPRVQQVGPAPPPPLSPGSFLLRLPSRGPRRLLVASPSPTSSISIASVRVPLF